MTEKKTYTPGDVASFLAKQSNIAVDLKEQSQLQALFNKQARIKPRPEKLKEAISRPPQRNKEPATEAAKSSGVVTFAVKASKEVERKSRKRPSSDFEPASPRETRDSSQSHSVTKRFKNSTETLTESFSVEKQIVDNKNGLQKLSKNERNAKQRVEMKHKKEILKENELKNKRTVFVGNVALTVTKKTLVKLFRPFGKVEAVRIRSVPVAAPEVPENGSAKGGKTLKNPGRKQQEPGNDGKKSGSTELIEMSKKPKKTPKKALVIMKQFDPKRHSMNAYVAFETEEMAQQSLQLNGHELEGLHIRVDMASTAKKHDHKSTIFVGNLSFDIEEESVREHFSVCGAIENVRIIRDKYTGSGKGFGYVKFEDLSSVNLALSLDGQELLGRPLRVKKAAKKPKKKPDAVQDKPKPRSKRTLLRNEEGKAKKFRPAMNSDRGGCAEKFRNATVSAKPANKPEKPLKKFGDLKNRLQAMKTSAVGSRKEKHNVKKAMREIIRERKKLSLGKLLTGEKKSRF